MLSRVRLRRVLEAEEPYACALHMLRQGSI